MEARKIQRIKIDQIGLSLDALLSEFHAIPVECMKDSEFWSEYSTAVHKISIGLDELARTFTNHKKLQLESLLR